MTSSSSQPPQRVTWEPLAVLAKQTVSPERILQTVRAGSRLHLVYELPARPEPIGYLFPACVSLTSCLACSQYGMAKAQPSEPFSAALFADSLAIALPPLMRLSESADQCAFLWSEW